MATVVANEFIERALILAGIIDEDEVPASKYITQGVTALNDMLQEWSEGDEFIPYITEFSFKMTPGKNRYTVGPGSSNDIVRQEIAFLTEGKAQTDGTTIYPLRIFTYNEYNRYDYENVQGPPRTVFLFKHNGFGELIFDAQPDIDYTVTLLVKQKYLEYTQFQTLLEIPA